MRSGKWKMEKENGKWKSEKWKMEKAKFKN
jgi:hypothetical protein